MVFLLGEIMKSKKNKLLFFCSLLVLLVQFNFLFSATSKKLVNKIVARVNGVNILKSDLEKPALDKNGESLTLEEAIRKELLLQKSAERKLLPTEAEVERQIVSLKIHNNITQLSDEDFELELKKEGFTLSEYKTQLARMLAVEKLRHAEFSERIVVTSQEVEDYYKKNPEKEEEKYLIKMCDIANESINEKGELVKEINYKWDDLGWVEKKDLSSNLLFVSNIKIGQKSKPTKIGGSNYQIVLLEDKKGERLKTLDERYSEIERILQDGKRDKFEKEFEKELRAKASITYLS